jgi:hypothetical protein
MRSLLSDGSHLGAGEFRVDVNGDETSEGRQVGTDGSKEGAAASCVGEVHVDFEIMESTASRTEEGQEEVCVGHSLLVRGCWPFIFGRQGALDRAESLEILAAVD